VVEGKIGAGAMSSRGNSRQFPKTSAGQGKRVRERRRPTTAQTPSPTSRIYMLSGIRTLQLGSHGPSRAPLLDNRTTFASRPFPTSGPLTARGPLKGRGAGEGRAHALGPDPTAVPLLALGPFCAHLLCRGDLTARRSA
jgi:hypothetical protein